MSHCKSIYTPHQMKTAKFKAAGGKFPGTLAEPVERYGEYAYWHIGDDCYGWYSKPQDPAKITAFQDTMKQRIAQGHLLAGNYQSALNTTTGTL